MTTTQTVTSTEDIPARISLLHNSFKNGLTRHFHFRKQQLSSLLRFVNEMEQNLVAALHADLRKSEAESLSTEIRLLAAEIKYTLKHLHKWMKPVKVSTPLVAQPGKSYITPDSLGVVLIIGPWNYPVLLMLAPLIGALAAGNCVVLKPSEVATAVSKLLARELPKYIDPQCLQVIEGGVQETTALLNEQFDYIFYTGNAAVGRIVMTAAAKHLTPVTLELGGKSPCIVDADIDINVTARRIVWGKFTNAGQTCVVPDYVLVEEKVADQLLAAMQKAINEFYGKNPQTSPDYGRIIDTRHLQRLLNLVPGSGDIYLGGQSDEKDHYISPTILTNVPVDSPVMVDEIFGPILPVLKVKCMEEAVNFINARQKPLALYLFSKSKKIQKYVIEQTSSGSVCVNYTMLQLVVPELPFGGVGYSGMGAYHGKKSFDTFTHFKSVLVKPQWFDLSILYPPYTDTFKKLIHWLM
jgi:aldehyde dehydrogenase (NAD+)